MFEKKEGIIVVFNDVFVPNKTVPVRIRTRKDIAAVKIYLMQLLDNICVSIGNNGGDQLNNRLGQFTITNTEFKLNKSFKDLSTMLESTLDEGSSIFKTEIIEWSFFSTFNGLNREMLNRDRVNLDLYQLYLKLVDDRLDCLRTVKLEDIEHDK